MILKEQYTIIIPLLVLGIGTCILTITASIVHPSFIQNKNFLVAFMPMYILWAYVISKSEFVRHTGLIFIWLLCFISLISFLVTGYYIQKTTYYTPYREQHREAVLYLHKHVRKNDVIFSFSPTRRYAEKLIPNDPIPNTWITLPRNVVEREKTFQEYAYNNVLASQSVFIVYVHSPRPSLSIIEEMSRRVKCLYTKNFIRGSILILHFSLDRCREHGLENTRSHFRY